jgi:hypothetical protein
MLPRGNPLLADRYVALRKATAFDHLSCTSKSSLQPSQDDRTSYAQHIEEQQRRCLSFSKHKTESTAACSSVETAYSSHMRALKEKKINVNLVKKMEAYQIIYAPDVADNYYGQRLDWSSQGVIGIGIQNNCYLYNNQTISKVSSRRSYLNCSLTSLKFNLQGTLLYLGDSQGELNVIDLTKLVEIRSFAPHSARIGCI